MTSITKARMRMIMLMSQTERKNSTQITGKPRRSLSRKTFVATLMLTAFIGVIILIAGFSLYYNGALREYRNRTFNNAKAVAMVLDKKEARDKADQILEIYDSVPEEERGDGSGQSYRSKFGHVIDSHFLSLQADMRRARSQIGLRNAFIVAIDEEYNRMIYLVDSDADPSSICLPGTWDEYTDEEIDVLVYGQEFGPLARLINYEDESQATITNLPDYGYRCTGGTTLYKTSRYTVMLCLDEKLDYLVQISKFFLAQYFLLLLTVILIASLIGARLMRRITVKPLLKMADAARSYADDKLHGLTRTNRFKELDLKTGDEIEELSRTMADMEDSLTEYEENMTAVAAERERIRTELDLARRIQLNMLPSDFPAFPEKSEFDIFASMVPAKEVGGDFYDFMLIDDDHLAFLIGDVSGKGVPAALFMTAVKIILDHNLLSGLPPGKVLEQANDMVCLKNTEEMFVTVWLGILELSTGRLTAANAGHEKPVLISPDGLAELAQDRHGFVIGGMPGMKYTEYELKLEPGSRIFIYSDGIPEATRQESEQFGTDRMLTALSGTAGKTPAEVLGRVTSSVDAFVGDDEQFDDMTMLCLEYKGTGGM